MYVEFALQTAPIMKIAIPALTVGYDFDLQHVSLGIGSLFRVTDKLYLSGEYFPLIDTGNNEDFGDKSAYAVGVVPPMCPLSRLRQAIIVYSVKSSQ